VSTVHALARRVRALLRPRAPDRDLEDEIAAHLDEARDDYVARGLSPEEARLAAIRDFGGVMQTEEACRDQRSFTWPDHLRQDLKLVIRRLVRDPGVTAIAVATLGLGIGVNTAVFSIVNGVLLTQMPFPDPDRLVALYSRTADTPKGWSSYPNFLDWVRESRSFSDLAAFRPDDLNLTGLGQAERLPVAMVSAAFFPLLGVQPVTGRPLLPADDRLGAAPVALISEGLWRRKLGSSPAALGGTLTLSGTAYVIVGVIPAAFRFDARDFHRSDVFLPIGAWHAPGFRNRKVSMAMNVVGRLKPGVRLAQADADMQDVARRLAERYPEVDHGTGITLVPLASDLVGGVRRLLLLLVTAVLIVLLIACANVANLLLARASSRSHEIAICIALGASRSRMIQQFLVECVVLALAGVLLGSLLALWGTGAALAALPDVLLPQADQIRIDGRVLLFTTIVSVGAAVFFGLIPAFAASRFDHRATRAEWRPSGRRHHRTQSAFVVVEIALALVLLIGAGLTIRSLATALRVEPGFRSDSLLVARVSMPISSTRQDRILALWRGMRQAFAAIPGIRSASLSVSSMPMTGDFSTLPFWLDGEARPRTPADMKWALSYVVDSDYQRVMGIPLQRGRFLAPDDDERSTPVVVIDDRFARRYFAEQDPIGRRIQIDLLNITAEIVGIVGHVKQWSLDETAESPHQEQCYLSIFQLPNHVLPLAAGDIGVLFRTIDGPLAAVGPIRRVLDAINGQAVLYREQAMDTVIADRLARRRFTVIVLGVFAALALLMACVGTYGVMSHLVGARRHEIAIRMALGAEQWVVVRSVLGDGAKMAMSGIALGVACARGLTLLIAGMLFGVSAYDPATLAAVTGLLTLVALAACYVPAWRATRADPLPALRND
jgi:predicted permease